MSFDIRRIAVETPVTVFPSYPTGRDSHASAWSSDVGAADGIRPYVVVRRSTPHHGLRYFLRAGATSEGAMVGDDEVLVAAGRLARQGDGSVLIDGDTQLFGSLMREYANERLLIAARLLQGIGLRVEMVTGTGMTVSQLRHVGLSATTDSSPRFQTPYGNVIGPPKTDPFLRVLQSLETGLGR